MSQTVPVKTDKYPVIFLHGHGQTGKAFQAKSGAVRSALKKTCSFHYVDAPYAISPDARSWVRRDSDPGEGTLEDLEKELEATNYKGIEDSFALITETILEVKRAHRNDQKIGIVGFSFGAAVLAAYVTKLSQCVDGEENQKEGQEAQSEETVSLNDIGFVAFFSGFVLQSSNLPECTQNCFTNSVPSYHCFGLQDKVVAPTRSVALVRLCRNEEFHIVSDETDDAVGLAVQPNHDPYVISHSGGHFVPSQAKSSFTKFVKQFV